jgi:lipopolysaccharide export system permease protein
MKTLDRYIAGNFLYGYIIALAVMLGMFLAVDLFLHLDEFAEHAELGMMTVLNTIIHYYAARAVLWFRDLGGVIIVIAAVFSMARLTRNNELIAIMASGVSLKRVLAPILFLALLLTGLVVAVQEAVIPRLSGELTRKHDQLAGDAAYDLWFIGDAHGNLLCCPRYQEREQTMYYPLIILREKEADIWRVVGRIQAQRAVYDTTRKGWVLEEGQLLVAFRPETQQPYLTEFERVDFYATNLNPETLPLRRWEGFKSLLSLRQLIELEQDPGTRPTELAEIAVQKHSRITTPIINLIMLMVALPVLVCRDPRDMKTAILVSFLTTAACFMMNFLCLLYATEVFFGQVHPALFTWLPIFVFFPIALVEIDSMRT